MSSEAETVDAVAPVEPVAEVVQETDVTEAVDNTIDAIADPAVLAELAQYDPATMAGAAAITVVLVQIIKSQLFKKSWPSYGLLTKVLALVVGMGVSFASMLISDITWQTALNNGFVATLASVFGYDVVKSFVAAITKAQK